MPTWVRVRDTATGHEFDADERSLDAYGDAIEVVEGYPEHSGPTAVARPQKPHTDKAGRPAARKATATSEKGADR
jgi:hypothetical protein